MKTLPASRLVSTATTLVNCGETIHSAMQACTQLYELLGYEISNNLYGEVYSELLRRNPKVSTWDKQSSAA